MVIRPASELSDEDAEKRGGFIERLPHEGKGALVVIAPHGGCIEPKTSEQAERVARSLGDLYPALWVCKGWKPGGGAKAAYHVKSTEIHESNFPELGRIIGRGFKLGIAFHGCEGKSLLVGGGAPDAWKERFAEALAASLGQQPKVEVAGSGDERLAGVSGMNVINRLAPGGGIQLEQPLDARNRKWREIADAVTGVVRLLIDEIP